ncbi:MULTISPECIES: glycoside hydrolase family 3 protein [Paenibacillus]|uniref:glycoside hydrolase family 3 protein n=1 Tax=Paenibacillus TaxID=44249 RepID=UPI0022B88B07|nr:glycoside hydrolase family 3 protein [Paenibacillus caseinilyticus]MCZ8520439.1 glycoside hydrolase family 3 protein [Paenibacillus caseinilyticus]
MDKTVELNTEDDSGLDLLHRGTLREKIGQLFVMGFEGTVPSEGILQLIGEGRIGGVIYFARNLESAEGAYRLTSDLQEAARSRGTLPLLVCTDQEGGMVVRIREGISPAPSNMAVGAAGREDLAYQAAYGTAEELRALGIGMNLAPVVDINVNPLNPIIDIRSYGDDAELVGRMGAASIRGHQEAGVSAVAKHFPGHGDTASDSHADTPLLPYGPDRLNRVEFEPFRRAVEACVDAIMTAHIAVPQLAPDLLPATLSRPLLTGVLREQLGFKGVIISDCMEMAAVARGRGVGEACVMALEAGVDLLLVSHTFEEQTGGLNAVEAAVREGRVTEARIDESLRRILDLKRRRALSYESSPWDSVRLRLCQPDTLDVLRSLREAGISAGGPEPGGWRLDPNASTLLLLPEMGAVSHSENELTATGSLGSLLAAGLHAPLEERPHPPLLDPKAIAGLAALSRTFGQTVVGLYDAKNHPEQNALVRSLEQSGSRLIVISLRNPADLAPFAESSSWVSCCDPHPDSLGALAHVLLGELEPQGTLPVTLWHIGD